jgi:hypothetical protein
MAPLHDSEHFRSFTTDNWRRLMELVDLVSVLDNHRHSVVAGDLTKGQAQIGDRLYALVEDLSLDCIQRGMGTEVAQALERLTKPVTAAPLDDDLHPTEGDTQGWMSRKSLRDLASFAPESL